jgi:hypothetical protein
MDPRVLSAGVFAFASSTSNPICPDLLDQAVRFALQLLTALSIQPDAGAIAGAGAAGAVAGGGDGASANASEPVPESLLVSEAPVA